MIRRPSTDGTRNPDDPPTSSSRTARVTMAIEAYSTATSSAAAAGATSGSSRDVGAAGVASTTRSVSTVSGARAEPKVRRKPDPDRASSRTGASVRTPIPRSSASRRGSRPSPPSIPANTGSADAGGTAAAAASSEPCSRSSETTGGTAANDERLLACPAYTPPSSGSASRSTTSGPRREPRNSATETSASPSGWPSRLVAGALETVVGQHAGRGQAVQVQRNAEQRPRQRAERAARPHLRGPGDRVHEVDPELRGETDRLGPAREHRLRADVDLHAGDRGQPRPPPTVVDPSSTSTDNPAATRSRAAVRPAMPPPTTTTSGRTSGRDAGTLPLSHLRERPSGAVPRTYARAGAPRAVRGPRRCS